MKRLLLPLLTIGLATAAIAEESPLAGEVLAREKEWAAAIVRKDEKALENILGSEYSLITANGETQRNVWLEGAVKWMDHKALEFREGRVQVYGDVAVVRCTVHWHVLLKGKLQDPRFGTREINSDFRITDVWVKRDGRWQVVLRHSTVPATTSKGK